MQLHKRRNVFLGKVLHGSFQKQTKTTISAGFSDWISQCFFVRLSFLLHLCFYFGLSVCCQFWAGRLVAYYRESYFKMCTTSTLRTRHHPSSSLLNKSAHQASYLFCAVKVSLWRCGPLYTTLLSPWLARAPSVRAMEPRAEGWRWGEEEDVLNWTFMQTQIKSAECICVQFSPHGTLMVWRGKGQ